MCKIIPIKIHLHSRTWYFHYVIKIGIFLPFNSILFNFKCNKYFNYILLIISGKDFYFLKTYFPISSTTSLPAAPLTDWYWLAYLGLMFTSTSRSTPMAWSGPPRFMDVLKLAQYLMGRLGSFEKIPSDLSLKM